jgi:DNA polymerase-3 subunit delta'
VAKKTSKRTTKKAARRRPDPGREVRLEPPAAQHPWVPLEDVIGQPVAVSLVDSAVVSGRLHHAWIFHGPEGVGKRTTALALGAMLLDPTTAPDPAGALRPDPESAVQRLARAGSHPDLHLVCKELAASSRDDGVRRGKQTTLAKQVVEEFLIEPAARTRVMPGESRAGKVFVIDEAHLLGIEAQNALLKTIEEPPKGTIVILVTPSEDRLLPTIRSRCQRVAFGPLDEASMRSWIERTSFDFAGVDPDWALRFAGGSPGTLRAIVGSGLGRWRDAVAPALDRLAAGQGVIDLGSVLAKLVDEAAAESVAGDPRASKDVANRVAARRMFRLLGESFRDLMRQAAARGDRATVEWATESVSAIHEAETMLASNVAISLVFEQLTAECVASG